MSWARVWGNAKLLMKSWLNKGESLISLSMARMARDRDEFRRHAQHMQLANALTILDIILTISFVIMSIVMLALSAKEKPKMPLRMWIIVYALHCVIHITFSIAEQKGGPQWHRFSAIVNQRTVEYGKDGFYLLWWAIGMFFIMKGGDGLFKSAPMLTGTVMFFAAFDILLFMGVLYVVTSLALLLFCCCPFLCAIFYYIGNPQELPSCPWCE